MNRLVWLCCLCLALVLAGSPAVAQKAKNKPKGKGPLTPAGQRYALLVGVRQYDKAQLTSLRYTENDVTDLAEVLRKAGYRRVVLLTQKRGADQARYLPTAANVRRELKGLLEDRTEQDTVLLAFAGHGLEFAGSDEPYFCPMDTRVNDRRTLVSLSEVYGALRECKARVKVLLSDCCRDDPLAPGRRSALGGRVFAPKGKARPKPPQNVVALFSCSAGESAWESEELKHGVFFHHVIQGLQGKAARAESEVTLAALTDYVQRRVRDFVKEEFGADVRQRPELVGRFSGTVELVRLLPALARSEVKLRELWEAARKHERAWEAKKAEPLLRAMVNLEPTGAEGLALRSLAWLGLKQAEAARVDALRAVEKDRACALAQYALGRSHQEAERYAEAVKAFTEAIRRNPRDADFWTGRGWSHEELSKFREAIEDFSKAIQLDPSLAAAHKGRGRVRNWLGQYARRGPLVPGQAARSHDRLHRVDQAGPGVQVGLVSPGRAAPAAGPARGGGRGFERGAPARSQVREGLHAARHGAAEPRQVGRGGR
jgi:uncharacterized caspase-like protein